MKNNYHTHTKLCNHAVGSDEEYVLKAIEANFSTLGFSDHCPFSNIKNVKISLIRMSEKELDKYVCSIETLREKYAGKINILLGLECEYFPSKMAWLIEMVKKYNIQYLILGVHYIEYPDGSFSNYYGRKCSQDELIAYQNNCIEAMETGYFACLAHPDLFVKGYGKWDDLAIKVSENICQKAKELNIPLGYNLNGLNNYYQKNTYGYPFDQFWQIASRYQCDVLIEYDAHNPLLLTRDDLYQLAENRLTEMGCHIINELKI
ncbi:MAG: histidinol-phosphatase [Erysipelotrichaceae bacterium]